MNFKIDWSKVSSTFHFAAQDEDASIWVFEDEPSAEYGYWACNERNHCLVEGNAIVTIENWKETVQERPK